MAQDTRNLAVAEYRDRVAGSWIGENIAVIMSLPFEGKPRAPERLTGYMRWKDPKNFAAGIEPWTPAAAPCDDDTYYEMVALRAFERFGPDLTPRQLGEQWLADGAGFYASSLAARKLMLAGHWPPESGHPKLNPHCNTIGAQFSSELYGMIAPGHINLAAATARLYNHINGYAEGSDGGVLFAAMLSEAMLERDMQRVVSRSLLVLDPRAPTRIAAEEILAFKAQGLDWPEAAARSQQRWKPLYPQVNNSVANAALVVVGLLYGHGDFLKTVSLICQAADNADTDCNAGTGATIVGAFSGLRGIPARLVTPLNDTYQVRPHKNVTDLAIPPRDESLTAIARRIAALGERFIVAKGGARLNGDMLLIPNPEPAAQPLEKWPE
ncbi:MAG: ADP-ribosylglycohydrolase family protein [Planctomycetes bacterium]|nr:ADP-ribosylglycohydrolase family protein [Planctomycetota bacterium]